MSTVNVLIAGVGGQGVVSAARLLAQAVLDSGRKVIVGQTFGASQRGGSVHTSVRIGDEVHGPLIGLKMADFLLAFDPYESLRYLQFLAPTGIVIVNDQPDVPVRDQLAKTFPPLEEAWQILKAKTKGLYRLSATRIARQIATRYGGRVDITNTVILGAATAVEDFPVDVGMLKRTLERRFKSKALSMNLEALKAGRDQILTQRGRPG